MTGILHFLPTSLRGRLILGVLALGTVAVGLVVAAGVVSAGYSASKMQEIAKTDSLKRVRSAIAESFRDVAADATILANTPPVQGIIRSRRAGGIDPRDGFTTEAGWQERLKAVLVSFVEVRPDYRQIRFIHRNGQELVRVDHRNGLITVATDAMLQNKADEPYIGIASGLAPGQSYLMAPTWNRENGRIEEPRWATSRMLMPIYDRSGTHYGVVVINFDTVAHLARILDGIELRGDVYIQNARGDTYLYDWRNREGRIFLDGEAVMPPEVLEATVPDAETATVQVTENHYVTSAALGVKRPPGTAVMLALVKDRGAWYGEDGLVGRMAGYLAAFGAVVLLSMVAATTALVRYLMAPFTLMKDEIARARSEHVPPLLPVTRADEVGAVSREFSALIQTQKRQTGEIAHLFNNVRDGLCTMNTEGRITAANPALEDLLGYDRGELVGKSVDTLMLLSERFDHRGVVRNHFTTGRAERIDRVTVQKARRKNGSAIDIELAVSRIDGEDGTYFAGTLRDVSARIKAQAERERLIAALEASNEELDRFAYVASHDLKAPMRAIETASQWLVEDLDGKLDEDTGETFDMLCSRVRRMNRLLDGLLEHARIGRQSGQNESPAVPGSELAEEIAELVDRPAAFAVTFTEGFRAQSFQAMPLRTVLLNLVGNAIKHREREDGSVVIDATREGDRYRLSVSDDGPGIEPRFHERVFVLFQTLRSRDDVEGSGLGLSIAQKHVRHFGGELQLISDGRGSGCRFEFTWPVAVSDAQHHAA